MPETLTVGSLFSGIGGLDLGLEWAGFETKWFCEIEEFPQKVLKHHWPEVPIYNDVREITADTVIPVDVIAGGFPCQDISWAGLGRGIDYDLSEQEGTRSGLWWEMWRVIRDLRPRYVIAENVPALTHRGLDIVLGSLAQIGYDAEWQTISAASVGAPHIRERVFIVAYPHIKRKQYGDNDGGIQGGAKASPARQMDSGIQDRGALWSERYEDMQRILCLAHGVSDRVGALKGYGNAVVPQVGYLVGRAVMEHFLENGGRDA